MSEVKKRGGGPKPKYSEWLTEEGLILISGWARNGLNNEQIAHNMGIHVATLYDWRNKFSELDNAFKINKEVADLMVENALFKSAMGYEYEEVTEVFDGQGNLIDRKVTKKKERPSNTAQIFYLKNRRPKEWVDVKRIESENKHTVTNPLEQLSADELRKLIEKSQD